MGALADSVLKAGGDVTGVEPNFFIENEKRIVEICDSLSIGAAIENMILTATGYGLGTLWIANTCFAYNELMDFIGTDSQLTGIVAVGFADEAPDKRPRKPFEEIVEYR